MKTFISILYRVRNLTEKMGYGQGHMQMGMAEKKGLLKFSVYYWFSDKGEKVVIHNNPTT